MAENTEINQLVSQYPSLTDVVPYSKGDMQTFKTTWQKVKDMMGIAPPTAEPNRVGRLTIENPLNPLTLEVSGDTNILFNKCKINVGNIGGANNEKLTAPVNGIYQIEGACGFTDGTLPDNIYILVLRYIADYSIAFVPLGNYQGNQSGTGRVSGKVSLLAGDEVYLGIVTSAPKTIETNPATIDAFNPYARMPYLEMSFICADTTPPE